MPGYFAVAGAGARKKNRRPAPTCSWSPQVFALETREAAGNLLSLAPAVAMAAVLDPMPTLAAASELAGDTNTIEILHGDVYFARGSWGTAPAGLDDGGWYTQAGKVAGAAGNDFPVSTQQIGGEPVIDPRQLVHDLFEPFGPRATLPEAPLASTLGTPSQPDTGGGGGAGVGAAGADHGSYGSPGGGSAPSGGYADLASGGASSPAAPPATAALPPGTMPAQPQISSPVLAARGAAQAPMVTPAAPPAPLDPGLGGGGPPANPADAAQTMLANRPLNFEANVGQWDPLVKYSLEAPGYRLFLTGNEAVFGFNQTPAQPPRPRSSPPPPPTTLQYSFLHMQFVGGNAAPPASGVDQLAATTNYLLGNDSTKWYPNVPNYGQVLYQNVWAGVDVRYHISSQNQAEYDFIVNPGTDAHTVRLAYQGATGLALDGQGNLQMTVAGRQLIHHAPNLYQDLNGVHQAVTGNYNLAGGQITFNVGAYDHTRPLVIDPVVDFSTYLGGNTDSGQDITVDSRGNVYVIGTTNATDFPVTNGAFQTTLLGPTDAFVTKFDPTGSSLVYSTYLGGSGGNHLMFARLGDEGFGIAVDPSGNAYLTGDTRSADFPTTASAFQPTYNLSIDGFVTKLNAQGNGLIYSSFLGSPPPPPNGSLGSDRGNAIAIDSSGDAFVTGQTAGDNVDNPFPTTSGAFQTARGAATSDAFVTEVNPNGTGLLYSTYLGGSLDQAGYDIALDSSGNVYVGGQTDATNFPTANPYQGTKHGGNLVNNGFVTKLNSQLSALVYSTYLGGSGSGGDGVNGLIVDQNLHVFVAGTTKSTDFPTTTGAYKTTFSGTSDAFVTEFTSAGNSLIYSTYLGGSRDQGGTDLAIDRTGAVEVTGYTNSTDFPALNPIGSNGGGYTAFVTRFNPAGSGLLFSSAWGGSGGDQANATTLDDLGNIYITGYTSSSDFPTAYPYQAALAGSNAFVTKIGPSPPVVPATCGCEGGLVHEPAVARGGNPGVLATSATGLRYSDGSIEVPASDLGSAGFGAPWGQARTWTSNPVYSFRAANGFGWNDSQLPYLIRNNGVSNNSIVAITRGTDARYFDLSGGVYQERLQFPDQLSYNSTSGIFTLIDGAGNQLQFYDFSSTWPNNQQGMLKSFTDPNGNTTNVTSHTADGKIAEVQHSSTVGATTIIESYQYNYLTNGINAGLLQYITLRRQVNGGAWSTVRLVAYSYYDGTTIGGNPGDLMLAQIEDAATPAPNILYTSYYRYYKRGEANGFEHGLKYAFSPVSFARLSADTHIGNPLTAADSLVARYADQHLQYDTQNRVVQQDVQGAGVGIGIYTYSYLSSTNPVGFNSWQVKTTETLPDGSTEIVYTNSYGEPMLQVFQAGGNSWKTFLAYDNQGRISLSANPSALNGYNENYPDLLHYQGSSYQYMNNSAGLITLYDYYSANSAGETTAGGVVGYLQDVKIEQGQQGVPPGTTILQSSSQYFLHSAIIAGNTVNIAPLANSTVYSNPGDTSGPMTSYSYTWFSGTAMAQQVTVNLPVISSGQNGPGVADSETIVNDIYGRPIWHKDADGFIDYTQYDQATGGVVKTIIDVNTNNTNDFQGPAPWTSTPGYVPLHLITQMTVDALGRETKLTDPNNNVTYTVYKDPNWEVRTYPGWNSSANPPGPTGPTEVSRADLTGTYAETLTMSAAPHLTGNLPDGTEAVGGLQTLVRTYTNSAGQVVNQDDYFNLTGLVYATLAHIGTLNTNYYETTYGYDNGGRPSSTTTPTGTLSVTDYDSLSRAVDTKVGTSTDNLVKTADYIYDNNTLGGASQAGDGNLTQVIAHPGGSAADRVSEYYYDWRNRVVLTKDGVQSSEDTATHRPISYNTYDNLDEVTQVQGYDGDGVAITTTGGVPNQPAASLLRSQSTAAYDDQGRVYQTKTFSVNQSTGAVSSSALITNDWYNHRGQVMASLAPGGPIQKSKYDGAGRVTASYVTDGAAGTSWSAAGSPAGDNVLQQTETTYDSDSNPILVTTRERNHDETATGALGNATTSPKARVSFTAAYYDAANRLTATVDVGTNGGTAYTRPSSVPAASDIALVTAYAYNAAGWVQDVTDPRGIVGRTLYDALGRTTKSIANYTGNPETANSDVATEYTYDGDNHQVTVQADQPGSAFEQTKFVYGVSTGAGSDVNSNDILAAVEYPDKTTGQPSTSEQVSYQVNALGEDKTFTDRIGNVHAYSFDVLGRETADAVTTLKPGVDPAVQRIETAYDTGGRPYLYTSYSSAGGGTANIVNQVQDNYNGLGQLITEYQAHGGAVDPSTTPKVQYTYSEMSGGNHSRVTSIVYPTSTRVISYNYASGVDDSVSRLTSLSDNSATLEQYSYLGLDTVVKRAHPQDGIDLTYIKQTGEPNGDAGDQYTGLDRFGRVVDQRWLVTANGTHTDRFQYSYDRDSNRLTRNNVVNTSFNETYGYDQLNQLTSFARGSHTQSWTLDALGNWSILTTDGTAQNRTHNQQNEVTAVGGSTLTFDANGNLTTDETGKTLVYDAWNRLVQVKNGGTPLVTYSYDALGRRVTETENGTTRDGYYSADWQVVEEQVGGSMLAQYVWSPEYVDALVERDQGGQRLYATQDANWNTTSLVDTSGNVVERYTYDPYGKASVLDGGWNPRSSSSYDNRYLFQGGRYDTQSGLYNYRHRDLSPTLGRWLENDPLGFRAGDSNLYRYVTNAPTVFDDPSGFQQQASEPDWAYEYKLYKQNSNGQKVEEKEGWIARQKAAWAKDNAKLRALWEREQEIARKKSPGYSEMPAAVAKVPTPAPEPPAKPPGPFATTDLSGKVAYEPPQRAPSLPQNSMAWEVVQLILTGIEVVDPTHVSGLVNAVISLERGNDEEAACHLVGMGVLRGTRLIAQARSVLSWMARYPRVIDPRTGRPIPFPSGIRRRVPEAQRATWDSKADKKRYIEEYIDRGYPIPQGGWTHYDIHHIQPLEFGGTNDFWNLVPVERTIDHQLFNRFWQQFPGF
jgi:RHS repeat-associated protein